MEDRRVVDAERGVDPREEIGHGHRIAHDFFREVIGFAEIEARKAGVRISVSVPSDLPAAYADKIMIEQVVLNLVKNGIEAMHDTPRSERELAISARANGKDFIEVKVADRGHGVLVELVEAPGGPAWATVGSLTGGIA